MPRVSIALDDELHRRLTAAAASRGESLSQLLGSVADEALRMAEHPGIVFRDGPTGRRAGLRRGPDVWEVIALLRQWTGPEHDNVRRAAEHMGLSAAEVGQAVRYWRAFPDEIESRIRANEAAAAEVWAGSDDSWIVAADDEGETPSPDPG